MSNDEKSTPIGEMIGNSIAHPPIQQSARPTRTTANNGIGTTFIAPVPAPKPAGPIPGGAGSGQITPPPASPRPSPQEITRGLGSNNIAPAPAQQQNGGQK